MLCFINFDLVYDKVGDVERMVVDDLVMVKMFELDNNTILNYMVKDIMMRYLVVNDIQSSVRDIF